MKYRKNSKNKLGSVHLTVTAVFLNQELKCAIVNRVVGKMFNSPSTHTTMNQIMCRYIPIQENLYRNDSHLVHSIIKIQKYRTARNNVKLLESVSQLKKTYSIRAAARKLNMQYSHLHRLLKCRQKHGRAVSKTAKENVIKSHASTKMSMQLPFKKYSQVLLLTYIIGCSIRFICKRANETGLCCPVPELCVQMSEGKVSH